jgi:hypothetical protein
MDHEAALVLLSVIIVILAIVFLRNPKARSGKQSSLESYLVIAFFAIGIILVTFFGF